MFSFLLIWLAAAVFENIVPPLTWDAQLGKYVRIAGTTLQWHSEGWTKTLLGQHGLTAMGGRAFQSPGPKFLFWGDSHVEALQVDDRNRVANLFNTRSAGLKAVAVGGGGLSVADYYFDMPLYAGLSPGIAGHVILISGMNDVLADRESACHAKFLSLPWRLVPADCMINQRGLRYGPLFYKTKMFFVYTIFKQLRAHNLRLSLGPVDAQTAEGIKTPSAGEASEGWAFLLASLERVAHGFLVFVYIPNIPRMDRGQICLADPEAGLKEAFAACCRKRGIGFIDLTPAFVRFYQDTRRFPRGFFNSPPGTGHLNEDGHRLVAEALLAYFRETRP